MKQRQLRPRKKSNASVYMVNVKKVSQHAVSVIKAIKASYVTFPPKTKNEQALKLRIKMKLKM